MRISIFLKLSVLLLVMSLIPLAFLGFTTLREVRGLQETIGAQVDTMNGDAVTSTTASLDALGETIIRQKAVDVAQQLAVYIKAHPQMTVADLQQDPVFKALAVQPVGQTGYTAVTDASSLIARFHAKNSTVNLDLHVLADKLPGFWGVMAASEGGKESSGVYDWKEPDGSIKQKYMFIAPVDARTADGVQFTVAATTYIDEFNRPSAQIAAELNDGKEKVLADVDAQADGIARRMYIILGVTALLVLALGFLFARSISQPLRQLTAAGNKVAEGDLSAEMPEITSNDEIKDLSVTMGLLTGAVKFLKGEQAKEETKASKAPADAKASKATKKK